MTSSRMGQRREKIERQQINTALLKVATNDDESDAFDDELV